MKTVKTRPVKKTTANREETTMDLPEVKDIPGQEHVRPMPSGEMADTTASSSDEEGLDILDTDEDRVMERHNSNVTREERQALRDSAESNGGEDDLKLKQALVDNTDEDGEPLNESADVSGSDLDVAGSEADDDNEEIGEEDEENNSYSLGSEKDDQNSGKQ